MSTTTTRALDALPSVPWLPPVLRRTWRAAGVLQIGLDPARAVVLRNVTAEVAWFINGLDGARTLETVIAQTTVAEDIARNVLRTLHRAGLLVDLADDEGHPPSGQHPALAGSLASEIHGRSLGHLIETPAKAMRSRERAQVVVVGDNRVASTAVAILAASGVGSIGVIHSRRVTSADVVPGGATLDDLGRGGLEVMREAVTRVSAHTRVTPVGATDTPDIVVLTDAVDPHCDRVRMLMHTGTVFLHATVRERRGVIGPFVIPGQSSCLQCQEALRRRRDPQWAAVQAQLLSHPPHIADGGELTLVSMTSAIAATQVLQWLDGERLPETINATLEIALPDLLLERRYWPREEACCCRIR